MLVRLGWCIDMWQVLWWWWWKSHMTVSSPFDGTDGSINGHGNGNGDGNGDGDGDGYGDGRRLLTNNDNNTSFHL